MRTIFQSAKFDRTKHVEVFHAKDGQHIISFDYSTLAIHFETADDLRKLSATIKRYLESLPADDEAVDLGAEPSQPPTADLSGEVALMTAL